MKLKYKVTLAFAIFIVGPFLIVGWISAYKASDSMKDELGRTTLQLVKQNHLTIEKSMSLINDKTKTFLDNYFFGSAGSSFWQGIETLGDIKSADEILAAWSSDGTDYSLYMVNVLNKKPPIDLTGRGKGFNYLEPEGAEQPEWTKHALDAGGAGTFRLIRSEDGKEDVRFLRSILNAQHYDQAIGYLTVSNVQVLLTSDFLSVRIPEGAGMFLFNDLDEPLMKGGDAGLRMDEVPERVKRDTEGYYFAEQDGRKWLFAYSRLSAFDTRLIYQIPLGSITGSQTSFQWFMMIISAAYLAFVLFFLLYLLRILVKPLANLVSLTKIYEPGKKLELRDARPRSDEFGILYGAILRMTRRLDQSIEENYVIKIKQKENELSALHSQITPHLLYNTLDSIYWYALDSGNADVGDMVKNLSRLLRIGLSKGKTLITIEEELEHAQAYGRLQMKRYPGTFELVWDIDESTKSCLTPKVILQPLIENAIFHAVSGMDGEGEIIVRVTGEADDIRMTVADNGFLPVDLTRLEAILEGNVDGAGYGIRNVHQRIRLHFGDAYGLTFERREGGGTAAIIRIPSRSGE